MISVIMGSQSDWDVMKYSCDILNEFSVEYEKLIISAHRTPNRLYDFAKNTKSNVIIAGAGGAAHLPGMVSSLVNIPVLGVPVKSSNLAGIDSLLSIVQMPFGVPVATFAIGKAGAQNAAIFAISILAGKDEILQNKLKEFRKKQTDSIALYPV